MKKSPGDLVDVTAYQLSPGIDVARGRTTLDAKKVFVVIDGRRVSLAKALQRIEGKKKKAV